MRHAAVCVVAVAGMLAGLVPRSVWQWLVLCVLACVRRSRRRPGFPGWLSLLRRRFMWLVAFVLGKGGQRQRCHYDENEC